MPLKPLEQWMCDGCGGLIENIAHGQLEWLNSGNGDHGYRIVHRISSSPKPPDDGCFRYAHESGRMEMLIENAIGTKGIVALLARMDSEPLNASGCSQVRDTRGWVELFRRLHVPYFEEARLYWDSANEDGQIEQTDEHSIYLPENLKALIERYDKLLSERGRDHEK